MPSTWKEVSLRDSRCKLLGKKHTPGVRGRFFSEIESADLAAYSIYKQYYMITTNMLYMILIYWPKSLYALIEIESPWSLVFPREGLRNAVGERSGFTKVSLSDSTMMTGRYRPNQQGVRVNYGKQRFRIFDCQRCARSSPFTRIT